MVKEESRKGNDRRKMVTLRCDFLRSNDFIETVVYFLYSSVILILSADCIIVMIVV